MPLKRRKISLDMPLLYLSLLSPFIKYRYSCDLPVPGQMTEFVMPRCRVRLSVAWSINAQSSPDGRIMGSILMGAEVGILMIAT